MSVMLDQLQAAPEVGLSTAGAPGWPAAPAVRGPGGQSVGRSHPGAVVGGAGRLGKDTEPGVPARYRVDLQDLAPAVAPDQRPGTPGTGRCGDGGGAGLRLQLPIGFHRRLSPAIRRDARAFALALVRQCAEQAQVVAETAAARQSRRELVRTRTLLLQAIRAPWVWSAVTRVTSSSTVMDGKPPAWR